MMRKSEALDNVSFLLTSVTNARRGQEAVARAELVAGLSETDTLDEHQLLALLDTLAAEGGPIQRKAEEIASWRADSSSAAA
ncbi:MAG: hypothetical protein GEU80_12795 [Dehalococcoidia bacterium]|nr:hypothetical protein [Dehalococcoidia bacterium]